MTEFMTKPVKEDGEILLIDRESDKIMWGVPDGIVSVHQVASAALEPGGVWWMTLRAGQYRPYTQTLVAHGESGAGR